MNDRFLTVLALLLSIVIHGGSAMMGASLAGGAKGESSNALRISFAGSGTALLSTAIASDHITESLIQDDNTADSTQVSTEILEDTSDSHTVDTPEVQSALSTTAAAAVNKTDDRQDPVKKTDILDPTIESEPITSPHSSITQREAEKKLQEASTARKSIPVTSESDKDKTTKAKPVSGKSQPKPITAAKQTAEPTPSRQKPSSQHPPITKTEQLAKRETTPVKDTINKLKENENHTKDAGAAASQGRDKDAEGDVGSSNVNTNRHTESEGRLAARAPVKSAIPLYHLIPKPPYPRRSRDLGEEGTVIIAILVGEDGSVMDAEISRSSGYPALDGSAIKTVKNKWKFKPGIRAGEPVESRVRVPIEFSIRNF